MLYENYYCYGRYWQILKKRYLRDQSQSSNERKKVMEGSSASSSDDTDVSGEESADCKAILFNCLRNLEIKVKETFDLANTTNESQIKGEQQLKFLL